MAVSREIRSLSFERVPEEGAIARAAAGAVGLKGKPKFNPFREVSRAAHEISIAMEVYHCHTKNRNYNGAGYSWNTVFEEVAAAHKRPCSICKTLKSGSVKAIWYRHALAVIPGHLVEKAKSKKPSDILR